MNRYEFTRELLDVIGKYDKEEKKRLTDIYINILAKEIEQLDIDREEAQRNFTLNF